jgi:hypothetical protein
MPSVAVTADVDVAKVGGGTRTLHFSTDYAQATRIRRRKKMVKQVFERFGGSFRPET